MKTLHLTLKKKWFDMILSGEKKEEYREIKPYWINRLAKSHLRCIGGDFVDKHKVIAYTFKHFDTITFKNGYSLDAPEMEIELLRISINQGMKSWGAEPDIEYFVLSLGEILSTKNINK